MRRLLMPIALCLLNLLGCEAGNVSVNDEGGPGDGQETGITVTGESMPHSLSTPSDTTPYSPSHVLPESGVHLALVFVSSTRCLGGTPEELREPLEKLKVIWNRRAQNRDMSFSVIGAALDWDLATGIRYLSSFGDFDEISVGDNWGNSIANRYDVSSIPEVLLVEREFYDFGTRYDLISESIRARKSGLKQIVQWVDEGAPTEGFDRVHDQEGR